jgi:hypothetical protein
MSGDFHIGDNITVSGTGNIGKITRSAPATEATYRELVAALRADAGSAQGVDGQAARNYADDLEDALDTEDPSRIDRVLGRIKSLLDVATSAFALSRGLAPPGG